VKTVQLEALLGRQVRDPDGKPVGRILAVSTETDGGDCVIREYLLGTAALLTRLGLSVRRLAGIPIRRQPVRVPWDQLDLSDPGKPRLRCPVAELKGGPPAGAKG
jgi:sporulation protein YlmC with PRC-barrel domain